MNRFLTQSLILVLIIILSGACSPVSVTTRTDSRNDLAGIRTFNFLKPPIDSITMRPVIEPEISRVIEAAIDYELAKKGYDISDDPDVWIAYWGQVEKRNRVVVAGVTMPPAYYYGPDAYGYSAGWAAAPVSSYKTGTLRVDIVNPTSNQLIWFGEGSGVLDPDPVKRNRLINVVVYKMFKRFPDISK